MIKLNSATSQADPPAYLTQGGPTNQGVTTEPVTTLASTGSGITAKWWLASGAILLLLGVPAYTFPTRTRRARYRTPGNHQ